MNNVMLAADCQGLTHNLKYPLLASPKVDGIRAYTYAGTTYSRNQKPIPNRYIQQSLAHLPSGLDGELIVGLSTAPDVFRATSSGVMSAEGGPNFKFLIFDSFAAPNDRYLERIDCAMQILKPEFKRVGKIVRIEMILQDWCDDEKTLLTYEKEMVELGYEGVMTRNPDAPYKFGRSTLKEGGLIKVKRFEDAEALVVGYKELQHNDNPAIKDTTGNAKRSSHKANKRNAGTLGALTCQLKNSELTFDVGTGFTEAQRAEYWAVKETLIGQYAKYTFFPTGSKERPRFPVWKGFRHVDDMGGTK